LRSSVLLGGGLAQQREGQGPRQKKSGKKGRSRWAVKILAEGYPRKGLTSVKKKSEPIVREGILD